MKDHATYQPPIDPASAVPLYHQIAQQLRGRIEHGDLIQGDHLASLRDAADAWQVNFHTVRHAYAELARDGLIEMRGPRGTRVIAPDREQPRSEDLDAFLFAVVSRAKTDFGLGTRELSARIASLAEPGDVRVHVVECSQHQCLDLSHQLQASWAVDAVAFTLDRTDPLPAGPVVATYFHYNEVRLRWPRQLASFFFLSIAPEPALGAVLENRLKREGKSILTVCEHDEPTAQAVIADVSAILLSDDYTIGFRIVDAGADVPTVGNREILLLPPRVWGGLTNQQKNADDLIEVRYTFDPAELRELGEKQGWPKASVQSRRAAS